MAEDPDPPSQTKDEARLYWDRLDAKFANMNAAPPRPPAASPEPPASAPPVAAASGLIAQAFTALLALEDGLPGAKPVRLTSDNAEPPPAPEPVITDAVVEDIVRRVVERLGPDAVRAVVVDVVSEISERLVKEEIERIRQQHG